MTNDQGVNAECGWWRPMFCKRCSVLTRQLAYDPAAEPRAELMSGACIWEDETSRDWCIECIWRTRDIFHLRHQLTIGEPVPPEALERWQWLEQEYPNWPVFRRERRSPEIARKVRFMVHRATRRACVALERMDREYRWQHGEGQD